ncbi:MAG TPA: response regulator [Terriglobales bacterium]
MMTRALLVDDDSSILQLFRSVLEMNGFEVVTASSARQAVKELPLNAFEMVITDLHMESPTAGFDVVRAAKELSPKPIIVIVTAYPVPSAEWRRAGADALYMKGANTLALPEQLRELLRRKLRETSRNFNPTGNVRR